jgi:hypothetical protein
VRLRRHATSTTGSRPGFRGKLFQLPGGDLRGGYHFRKHQQFVADDQKKELKDQQ